MQSGTASMGHNQPILHQRIPGAESEMSVFSNTDVKQNTDMRLPEISRQDAARQNQTHNNSAMNSMINSAIKNNRDQGSDIKDLNSPATVNDSQQPGSPMRRSFSPDKTFFSYAGSQARGTMSNFNFKQDKDKMDAAAERLIHSVNAVTDLLKANTKLRDNIEKVQRELEDKDGESF